MKLSEFRTELKDFFWNLIASRVRRGLVDAGGTALKWLFGIPEQKDLQMINDKIHTLFDKTQNVKHIIEHPSSIIHEYLMEIESLAKAVSKNAIDIHQTHIEVQNLMSNVQQMRNRSYFELV